MPTILRVGSYRCFFYPADGDEPPHVHVEQGDNRAKVWLADVRLENSTGFNRVEIGRVLRLVEEHRDNLLRAWDAFFGN